MGYNFVIGPVKGNRQSITIMNRDNGEGKTVMTTPEKIDEFVKSRKKAQKIDICKQLGTISAGTLLGYLGGLIKSKEYGVPGAAAGLVASAIALFFLPDSEKKVTEHFLKNNA